MYFYCLLITDTISFHKVGKLKKSAEHRKININASAPVNQTDAEHRKINIDASVTMVVNIAKHRKINIDASVTMVEKTAERAHTKSTGRVWEFDVFNFINLFYKTASSSLNPSHLQTNKRKDE